MKVFLLDLWHDLQAKRLWPVALVLALALVAVPVLVAKPADESAPAPSADAAPKPDEEQNAELAEVKLAEEGEAASGSTLGVFDPANPFKPPKRVVEKADDQAAAGKGGEGKPAQQGGAAAGSGEGSSAGKIGSSGGGSTGGGSTGGGSTGGSDPGGSAPATPPNTGGGPTTTTKTTVYKYVVDLTFSANGRTRRIKGFEKLDMLPSQASPLLISMGVTADGGNAVFLVDSTLRAAGEGSCKPSGKDCAFAYIGPGSEHVFNEEDGDSYTVRIDEIRKVKVKRGAQAARARKAAGARARAAAGSSRRFVPPLVADLVVVATERPENSNGNSDHR
jgi:hypothetical protein